MRARLLCLVSVRLGRVMAVPASLLVMLFWAPQLQAQLVITNNSPMPNGAVGVFYYQVLTTNNPATSGFTRSVIKGTLPPGLDLNPFGGALTGSPTAAGPYSFTILVTDSISTGLPTEVATKDFVLTVISLTVTAVIP